VAATEPELSGRDLGGWALGKAFLGGDGLLKPLPFATLTICFTATGLATAVDFLAAFTLGRLTNCLATTLALAALGVVAATGFFVALTSLSLTALALAFLTAFTGSRRDAVATGFAESFLRTARLTDFAVD
jgi:hypothetical protein